MTTHVEERPKISDAVKNYLSFRLASALAPLEPADTESGVDALPSPTELQAMARSLLLAVNRETLPSEFAQIMRTLPNGKPTRVFGRTLVRFSSLARLGPSGLMTRPSAALVAAGS